MGLMRSGGVAYCDGKHKQNHPYSQFRLTIFTLCSTVAVRESGSLHQLLALVSGANLLVAYEDDANLL
jgi:hypothetical protein